MENKNPAPAKANALNVPNITAAAILLKRFWKIGKWGCRRAVLSFAESAELLRKYRLPLADIYTLLTLTMKNYLAKVKLFTLNGPIPCAKITLECRSCCCVYGVCQYSEKSETHFYPAELAIEMVQVSNVTYIDLQLYIWFPSLR